MSTPARLRPSKTIEDYMKLPEGTLAELIEGEILMSPAPKTRHQRIVGRFFYTLTSHANSSGTGEVFIAPYDVHLPSGDIVQPDLIFISVKNRQIVRDWIYGSPDLLIEIISETASRDRIVKRALYATNGVKEYWIVDPDGKNVEVLTLKGNRYDPAGYFEESDTLTSPLLKGLSIPLKPILE